MKKKIIQIIISFILFIITFIIDKLTSFNNTIMFFIYLVPYIVSSYDIFMEAYEGIENHKIFNENVLMIIASVGAFLMSFVPGGSPLYSEGIFVMIFYQVGELFEIIAEGAVKREMKSIISIRADTANLEDGSVVDPRSINVGDVIIIKAGEKVPLDGVVIDGESSMNTLAITGESLPIKVSVGSEVSSGFVNNNGILKVRVVKTFKDSTASRIIELVKGSSRNKSKKEKFITKFSSIYTPIVIMMALFIAIVPSIITHKPFVWILRGLTFLVVSCPCALVISVPLSFFGGVGASSKIGVLFKGTNYLEDMSDIGTIIFDKTGTLTKGLFEVVDVYNEGISEKELISLVYNIELNSNHPIATSFTSLYDINSSMKVKDLKEIDGYGIECIVDGEHVYIGNFRLMEKIGIKYKKYDKPYTVFYVATDKKFLGYIAMADKLREDASSTISYFNRHGVETILLSGDKKGVVDRVSSKLHIGKAYNELLPEDKCKIISKYTRSSRGNVVYVGDGINDSPSLAMADVGISMGGVGSYAAVDASDVILMNDKLSSLIDVIKISNKTCRIAKENIVFSISIKIIVLILSMFGITNMWMAVFADVGVTIIAVINSCRCLHIKRA